MKNIEKKNQPLMVYLLTAFGILITLNFLVIRYSGDFFLPLIKATLLVTGIGIYGFFINFLFARKESEIPEALASGLIFSTFYFFLSGSLKLLVPATIILFYLLPLPILVFLSLKKRNSLNYSLKSFFNRPAAEYGIFIFPLIYAALPSSFYDTMVYHLGIPNLFLQHQGFVAMPQMIYANTSIYYEISLIPSLFAGPLVPRIFHFLIGIVFCLTLVDTAVRFFNLKRRFFLLLLLVSMPLTFFLITTIKNDLPGAFFILAGIRCYLKDQPQLSAVFWGFSVGIKYFNALPLAIFLIYILFKDRFKKIRINFKVVVFYSTTTFLLLLPLLIKNYLYMNNPFFPFFTRYFEHGLFDLSRYELMKEDVGVLIHSFKDFLLLPYTLSFRELGSGGLLGVQFLVFLPFIILKKKIERSFYFYFSLILIFSSAFFTASIRFQYIAAALLSIYIILVYENLDFINAKVMKFIFFILIALNIITTFGFHERIYKASNLYSGKMNIETYKTDMLPTYPAISYINNHTSADSFILIVGDTRNYYLQRPYYVSSAIDYSILKEYLSKGSEFGDFIAALKKDKIDYILYNAAEFQRLNKTYQRLNADEVRKFFRFLNFLKPVFKKNFAYVFKIPATAK